MSRSKGPAKIPKGLMDPVVKELGGVKTELSTVKHNLKDLGKTMSQLIPDPTKPLLVKSRGGVWATIFSLLTIATTIGSFAVTAQSLQKEELSQFFTSTHRVEYEVRFTPGSAIGPGPEDHSTYFSTVVTNTGRLPITVISFLTGPEDGAAEVDNVLWVRMQDASNTVLKGPFVLAPGEAVAVRQKTIGTDLQTNLVMRQSDGRTVAAKILESAEGPLPSSVEEKFDAMKREWEKSPSVR